MVTVIQNVSGRLKTYVLTGKHLETHLTHPHRHKPVKLVTVHQAKNGTLAVRSRSLPMADSLRLAAGEVRKFDDDLVLHCPDVKAAIARGDIRVLKQEDAAKFAQQEADAKAEADSDASEQA